MDAGTGHAGNAPPRGALPPMTVRALLLAALCLALPAWAAAKQVRQEPLPAAIQREAQAQEVERTGDGQSVTRERGNTDISPPVKARPRNIMGDPPSKNVPLDMESLSKGWDRLGAGDAAQALAHFQRAARSPDRLLAKEAQMGQAYALWRLGREDEAEAVFKRLLDLGFRTPEVLPNLLFLLHKKGGPKAVEPYLHLLPEQDRDIWRK